VSDADGEGGGSDDALRADPSGPADPEPLVTRLVVEVRPLHLDRLFDYLVPDDLVLEPGHRVQVAFAGRSVRALVVEVGRGSDVPASRLRPVRRRLGEHHWARPDELEVLRWAARRYGAPLADVVRHALPGRTVDVERRAAAAGWYPPGTARRATGGPAPDPEQLEAAWSAYGEAGSGLRAAVAGGSGSFLWRPLPDEDVAARLGELVQLCLAGDRDVVLVVPDPASPVAEAVVAAAGDQAVDVRGGPSSRSVYRRWLEARCGRARVVVGERGVAFWPLDRLGLTVLLDEANPALKERRSPRHHAREVLLERARRAGGVGLLVGTVPSAPAWRLLRERRVVPVVPARQAERDARPRVRVVTGEGRVRTRISKEAVAALRRATDAGSYGVVLASRRGEGRALVCAGCGQRLACPTCAASLAASGAGVHCEGCGWSASRVPACEVCRAREVVPLAAGAARLGRELERTVDAPVAVLEGYGRTPPPAPAVVVATRGSVLDAPWGPVGAVVLGDLDGSLLRPSLDAAEDTLRLAMALARWTVQPGAPAHSQVIVETREPEHPAVKALAAWDPGSFWRAEAEVRAALRFPPAAHALRLEVAGDAASSTRVAEALPDGDDLLGPVPHEGREAFLLKCDDRDATLAALRPLREEWSRAGVEVRLDVDPVDAG
jgi:primosomal protein N' (replication factor Y) (superfamily II helicase)